MNALLEETAKRCPAGSLPDTYMVFDTETNGTSISSSRILQYGFCCVENRKIVKKDSFLVNHGPDLDIPVGAFNVHGISVERTLAEGVPFEECVPRLVEMFESWRKRGLMFVGHNMMAFDAPLFEQECTRVKKPFKFNENEIVDTGMMVKAYQLGMSYRMNDTLRSFGKWVSGVRAKGVFWSLDRYCYEHFKLQEISGINKEDAHDAGVDCMLTHFLLERLRV
jgi:DNA polymerase III epsilon subunit-like protein